MMKNKKNLLLLIAVMLFTACAATNTTEIMRKTVSVPSMPKATGDKKLVAIAGFENRSTYASDKLWDTSSQLLFTSLVEEGYFRVVEWEKMKQLFDWDALSTSSLIKSPEKMGEARRILLCEYFLSGAVTYFDVSQKSEVSAFSKSKLIETTVRVDLLLQDSRTGEYVSAAKGESTERNEYRGGITGGQTGSWDPKSADIALSNAIRDALAKLTIAFDKRERNIQ